MSTGFSDSSGVDRSIPVAIPPELDWPTQGTTPPIRNRRRVLHIINGEHFSGAERVQDLLAARLPESGYEVGFACMKPDRFRRARQYQDAPIHDVPMRSRFDFRAVGQLSRIVDAHGYELIHAHTPRSVMIGKLLAKRRKVPLIYHVHSPTSRDSTRPLINRINSLAEKISLIGVAKLITVSESLSCHMQDLGYPSNLISVVPNGVPCVGQIPQHAVPVDQWTLGTLALFRPRKGTELLLDALALLRDQGFDVRLRAVGGFETEQYERSLRQRAEQLRVADLVEWLGFQRDVNQQLQQMDLFVLPSLFGEGLPMVVLEAMAMGIPVVATAVEGVPEAIRDGIEGRIARPGDAANLAKSIRSILDGECSWPLLRDGAIARQTNRFSDLHMAEGVAAVYDEVLGVPAPLA